MTRRSCSAICHFFQQTAQFGLTALLLFARAGYAQENWLADKLGQDDAPTVIEGEQLTGRPDREVRLQRQVEVTRGQTVVNADQVYYDIVDDRVEAEGDVRVLRAGDRFNGNTLKLKLDTGIGYMDSIVYRLLKRNAQGHAQRIDFESEDVATISDGVYTTCNGPDPDWYLKTSKLNLDDGAGIGRARNAVLVFKGVPVAGTPGISFPLTEGRKSGFLASTLTTSTNTGVQLTVPYYWDIAPNRDLTLFPRYMSTRGLMLGADARYLDREFAGETRFEFMNDSDYANRTRYALSARHNHNVYPDVSLALEYNNVSDNDYARDFPFSHVFDRPGVNRRLLRQTAKMSYSPAGPWSGTMQLADFQVLQDPNATIVRVPYARLPQIDLYYDDLSNSGFNLSVGTQYTNFSHPTEVQGHRLIINPRVSYHYLRDSGYFLVPSVSAHGTYYDLNQLSDSSMTAPSRFVPTLSLDSGLMFERNTLFFGRSVLQTLEPRAYYTNTSYVQQNGGLYPNFDTTIADLSYGMIFRENRFIGNDRIGDANQLTLAMTSRYLESDGAERLRLAIAQRFNFVQPRVGLETDLAASSSDKSDVLMLATGRVTRETRLDANFQYNQERSQLNRVNFGVYWQPEPLKLLNLQYRKDSRNLDPRIFPGTKYELLDLSGQWPIAARWYGVGRINYLLDENRVGQSLVGVEHQADCWIFRLVSQRVPTAAGVVNNTTFLQLEFNGLSSLGTNPMRALRFNIPGYQSLSQPTTPAQ